MNSALWRYPLLVCLIIGSGVFAAISMKIAQNNPIVIAAAMFAYGLALGFLNRSFSKKESLDFGGRLNNWFVCSAIVCFFLASYSNTLGDAASLFFVAGSAEVVAFGLVELPGW